MKRCNNCKTRVPDVALFCGKCRSTFGVKICFPGRHINPVDVTYCLTCGSEEMSQPDRRPWRVSRLVVFIWMILVITALALLAAYLATEGSSPANQHSPAYIWKTDLLL